MNDPDKRELRYARNSQIAWYSLWVGVFVMVFLTGVGTFSLYGVLTEEPSLCYWMYYEFDIPREDGNAISYSKVLTEEGLVKKMDTMAVTNRNVTDGIFIIQHVECPKG